VVQIMKFDVTKSHRWLPLKIILTHTNIIQL